MTQIFFFYHLFFLVVVFTGAVLANSEGFLKRDNSLLPPYTNGNWDFFGTTLISPKHIILTTNHQSQYGAIFNKHPIQSRHWEVQINFRVHGNDGLLFGDGLAFWYLNETLRPGHVFGAQAQFRGLAVFLDTYSNHNGPHHHEHPYISAMLNDGGRVYDHDTDGTHTQLDGCTCHFRNKQHETQLLIRYKDNTLTVMTDIDKDPKWTPCFTVNDIHLPSGYYLAVSAATGELSDNHEIVSMKTFALSSDSEEELAESNQIVPSAAKFEPEREHKEDDTKPSRWSDFKVIAYIVLLLLLALGGFFAYQYYQRQRHYSKRFY